MPPKLKSRYLRVIVSGLGGFESTSQALRNTLADEQGFATLSFGPLRKSHNRLRDLLNPQLLHCDTIEAVLDNVIESPELADLPEAHKLDLGHFVLDLHSMASLSGTRYAKRHPGEIVLANIIEGVGAEPKVGLGFIPRLGPSLRHDIGPPILHNQVQQLGSRSELARKSLRHNGTNFCQTVGEVVSCMLADITDDLPVVRALGTKLTLLYGGADNLVHAEPAIATCGHLVDAWRIVPDMTHLGPQVQASVTAQHLAEMTHELLPALA